MSVTIIISIIGTLAIKDGIIIDKILFDKNPKTIAEKLESVETGGEIAEITLIIKRLIEEGYDQFIFENEAISKKYEALLGVKVKVVRRSPSVQSTLKNIDKFALEVSFVKSLEEMRELTRQVSLELSRLKIKRAGERRDLMIAQAIQSIVDLDKTINLFISRIREWYGVHFPELDRMIEKNETYARLVANLGRRQNFTVETVENEGLPKNKSKKIAKTARGSMGSWLVDEDIKQIQLLSRQTLQLYRLRENLQAFANATVEVVAPNIQSLVGPTLAGRLIALAGGLVNLAKMPASTIQVLGAEKALFRALRTGARPPKHGIIFQDTLVHEAKKWQRGKMSRALAGKLAIAARADAFSTRYIGDSLKAALDKRVDEIKEKYSKPKPRTDQIPRKVRSAYQKRRRTSGS